VKGCTIVWFRRDLRLADNPALQAALQHAERVIPLYIHAPQEEHPWQPGAASRWWQHHALNALDQALQRRGSRLVIRQGDSLAVLAELVRQTGATALHWNRLYDPATIVRDKAVKCWAADTGLHAESHNGSLLVEPWALQTGQGRPYRVFTPFHKACLTLPEPGAPLPAPDTLPPVPGGIAGLGLEQLELLPRIRWDQGLADNWTPGETGARRLLTDFADAPVGDYAELRDRPDLAATSRLSPYLHHGELSPRQVHWACRAAGERAAPYLRQLYWREFGHHLLFHFPQTPERPLDQRFADFPWSEDAGNDLAAWQRGHTGFPIVDAGMRELWHTGWMHNRVRMLVASLLTKNLLIPWQHGARWFWDTLVDADLANNTLGWQWTAGCGADAAPYFRIFNPVLQGEKFDPRGDYVRRWVPELARLPDKWLQKPWEAPVALLDGAGLAADSPYRGPLLDLKASRQLALGIWDQLKAR
jgi:deoxyribodipyrimidine photo-lyase